MLGALSLSNIQEAFQQNLSPSWIAPWFAAELAWWAKSWRGVSEEYVIVQYLLSK